MKRFQALVGRSQRPINRVGKWTEKGIFRFSPPVTNEWLHLCFFSASNSCSSYFFFNVCMYYLQYMGACSKIIRKIVEGWWVCLCNQETDQLAPRVHASDHVQREVEDYVAGSRTSILVVPMLAEQYLYSDDDVPSIGMYKCSIK